MAEEQEENPTDAPPHDEVEAAFFSDDDKDGKSDAPAGPSPDEVVAGLDSALSTALQGPSPDEPGAVNDELAGELIQRAVTAGDELAPDLCAG